MSAPKSTGPGDGGRDPRGGAPREPVADDVATVPSRARWLAVWAAVSLLAVVVAFWLGQSVRSPLNAAIANATARPEVIDIVVHRSLAVPGDAISGTVHLGTTIPVSPPTSKDDRQVVTGTGVQLGTSAVVAVAAANEWTAVVGAWWIVAAPAVGAGAGLLSSLYPALRAAAVHPALAVRSD